MEVFAIILKVLGIGYIGLLLYIISHDAIELKSKVRVVAIHLFIYILASGHFYYFMINVTSNIMGLL